MLRLAAFIAVMALALTGTPLVAAAQAPSLNWGSQVNPARCPTDQGYRYLEINVTRKVDDDFALSDALAVPPPVPPLVPPPDPPPPPYRVWAVRDFNQHIQVWRVGVPDDGGGAERFCALVRYQGSFTTLPPSSPGAGVSVAGGSDGSFEGGYLLVFNADELPSPTHKTNGHIGTFQGPFDLYDWRRFYFDPDSINSDTLQWWGWIYHGGNNGAWVNSIGGNQGDITD